MPSAVGAFGALTNRPWHHRTGFEPVSHNADAGFEPAGRARLSWGAALGSLRHPTGFEPGCPIWHVVDEQAGIAMPWLC